MKYAFIRQYSYEFPTLVLCRVLRVSRSGYYAWNSHKKTASETRREALISAVKRSFEQSRHVYGYRKVREDLVQERKLDVCAETVRALMRDAGLRSKVRRRFVVTTDSNHAHPIAENIVARDFTAAAPNEKWAADITYIRTLNGWLYLAAVMDLYSRRIVGWSFSTYIDTALVCAALKSAILRRHPQEILVHHSDRGVQYAAGDFQDLLLLNGISCSMSRKGDPWDNACMESFFGKLKGECVGGRVFASHAEAERELFCYIEVFYNRSRRHASLGYVSPADYEARARTTRAA